MMSLGWYFSAELAREVRGRAVGEVAAVVEGHAHDGVSRLGEDRLGGVVCLGARVRLDVCETSAKELLHTVTREVLDLVDRPAAAVVAVARKALCVLVGERGPNGLHHRERDEVLGGDELDGVALSRELVADGGGKLGVGGAQVLEVHGILLLGPDGPRQRWLADGYYMRATGRTPRGRR